MPRHRRTIGALLAVPDFGKQLDYRVVDNGRIREYQYTVAAEPENVTVEDLSYSALRSRMIEAGLLAQCLMVPLTLVLAGPHRLFNLSSAWYLLMVLEVVAMMVLYLYTERRARRRTFWPMAAMMTVPLLSGFFSSVTVSPTRVSATSP